MNNTYNNNNNKSNNSNKTKKNNNNYKKKKKKKQKKKKTNRRAAAPAPAPLLEAVAGPALSGRLSIFVLCLCQLCPVSFWMPCLPHVVGRRSRSLAWTREPLGQSPARTLLCPTLSSFSHFRGLLCPGFVQFFFLYGFFFFFHKI